MNTNLCELDHFNLDGFCVLSSVIQFDQCIAFLDKIGKLTYGQHFEIHPKDYKVIFSLLVYFYYDMENADRFDIDLRKGILLSGPVGCGKTALMFLMRFLLTKDHQFIVRSTRDVRLEFIQDGFPVLEKYSSNSFMSVDGAIRPKVYCFDDLGLESNIKHFGNDTNVMAEVLLNRYPLFVRHNMKTHATTNHSAVELEKIYGNRVRSRMREMFNLIAFSEDAQDKRR